ncbi:GNAT family N-acetyltransferase [Microtetraspora sp. NBRC 16547]|uniref:GNAT family N-acetyltransferase n=1 Tax=Microtetraspora sp. NBRC 16547 TaxID=3030993 RepID=UPI002555AD59|nr:GNAT family N-acetyltransferase [Microtetraspora sp. NBRC 16547]
MTNLDIRDATANDLDAIAEVAIATGQDEEWSGADPAYIGHLLAHGRVVVAERHGKVTGFGATRRIGDGPDAVTMLCDLFVDPGAHGRGAGNAMLATLWQDTPRRMTFSSLHAHALPLYTRSGLDAWWPLLYLGGDVRALHLPSGWTVSEARPDEVAESERRWTGVDRAADHAAWAARPGGRSVLAARDGAVVAAAAVAGTGPEYGIVHMAVEPGAGPHAARDNAARDAVVAVLASLDPPGGRARVCLPAPHAATRALLSAGWRSDSMDVFMATDPGLLDPRRSVPSPALA